MHFQMYRGAGYFQTCYSQYHTLLASYLSLFSGILSCSSLSLHYVEQDIWELCLWKKGPFGIIQFYMWRFSGYIPLKFYNIQNLQALLLNFSHLDKSCKLLSKF